MEIFISIPFYLTTNEKFQFQGRIQFSKNNFQIIKFARFGKISTRKNKKERKDRKERNVETVASCRA